MQNILLVWYMLVWIILTQIMTLAPKPSRIRCPPKKGVTHYPNLIQLWRKESPNERGAVNLHPTPSLSSDQQNGCGCQTDRRVGG
mmetsp:Transcript_136864/g.237798  ORF Transcript_136864/g.237798 Transcript_136864/m.237798 type:complete len:85 (+) Transcript_136864:423-677(+)